MRRRDAAYIAADEVYLALFKSPNNVVWDKDAVVRIIDRAISSAKTKLWRCECCGEEFDEEVFSHTVPRDNGAGIAIESQCGPVIEVWRENM